MQTSSDYSSSESKTRRKAWAYVLGSIGLQMLWFMVGLVLIAAGTIDTVPTQDAASMSDSQKQVLLDRAHTSDVWSAVWMWGELVIVIVSVVLLVYGLRLLRRNRRQKVT